jgi:hypothetical protein
VAAGCSPETGSAGSSSGGNVISIPDFSVEPPVISPDARRGTAADAPNKRRHTVIILSFITSPAVFFKIQTLDPAAKNIYSGVCFIDKR